MKIRYSLLFTVILFTLSLVAQNPKREFRGAWLHVIGQSQWMNKTPSQQRDYIVSQIDLLERAGCNAIFFQVRPTADALYKSDLEPWSKWLTGKRGKAPAEDWDPLAFAVDEAHKKGMELHAWLNPYRVTSDAKEVLPDDHDVNRNPHLYVKFNGQTFFDPAYRENRDFICAIIEDITKRYDVDGIHIDDYFYPYPVNGMKFTGDDASYAKFGNGKNRDDWRRENVDKLIEQIHATIKGAKPWVRFGVSPFGIWRNKSSDPKGSNSGGLQNYDDLFADPILWAKKGWIDYLAPQLYWALDLKVAPSRHLAQWWNDNANGVDIYIGQDTKRTMDTPDPGNNAKDELDTKIRLSRSLENVKGNVWWHGYWVTDNYKGVADRLRTEYQSTLALAPAYGDRNKRPDEVTGMKFLRNDGRLILGWDKAKTSSRQKETDAVKYVVYEFLPGENPDNIDNAEAIISITPNSRIILADKNGEGALKGNTYVVTAVDRMNRESKGVKLTF